MYRSALTLLSYVRVLQSKFLIVPPEGSVTFLLGSFLFIGLSGTAVKERVGSRCTRIVRLLELLRANRHTIPLPSGGRTVKLRFEYTVRAGSRSIPLDYLVDLFLSSLDNNENSSSNYNSNNSNSTSSSSNNNNHNNHNNGRSRSSTAERRGSSRHEPSPEPKGRRCPLKVLTTPQTDLCASADTHPRWSGLQA